jgi:predicted short-subunit dehydrogenase-like oxidoreductase (DUF2520 family)
MYRYSYINNVVITDCNTHLYGHIAVQAAWLTDYVVVICVLADWISICEGLCCMYVVGCK